MSSHEIDITDEAEAIILHHNPTWTYGEVEFRIETFLGLISELELKLALAIDFYKRDTPNIKKHDNQTDIALSKLCLQHLKRVLHRTLKDINR